MKLLIKIPTREREYKLWIDKYLDNMTNPNTRILLSLDHNDTVKVPFYVESHPFVHIVRGDSHSKIHAINRDINEYQENWDVLLVGSDDMWPMVIGFDQIILDDMAKHYSDTDGCLWYHTEDHEAELKKRHKRTVSYTSNEFYEKWICMMPVMGRAYYDRFKYVYHPSYKSYWCDNEQTLVAHRMRKITYIHKGIIKHANPDWMEGGMPVDELYEKVTPDWPKDKENYYRKRLPRNFPI